jgi:hypothetical protein
VERLNELGTRGDKAALAGTGEMLRIALEALGAFIGLYALIYWLSYTEESRRYPEGADAGMH